MYLVVSVNHPLAKYKEVSIRTALHYAFVILQMEDSLPNPLQYWCLGKNIEMSIGLETDHLPTYINAIRGGKVIGCWPEIALTMPELRSCKDLKVLSVKDLPRFCVYGLMTQESYEKNKDVMEILLQVIRQKSE